MELTKGDFDPGSVEGGPMKGCLTPKLFGPDELGLRPAKPQDNGLRVHLDESETDRIQNTASGYPIVVRIPPTGIPLEEIERQAVIEALRMSNWVQKDAAELLRISKRTMSYKVHTVHKIPIPRDQWRAGMKQRESSAQTKSFV